MSSICDQLAVCQSLPESSFNIDTLQPGKCLFTNVSALKYIFSNLYMQAI
jgi:hypothetical protein